jgi:hypothetical protein
MKLWLWGLFVLGIVFLMRKSKTDTAINQPSNGQNSRAIDYLQKLSLSTGTPATVTTKDPHAGLTYNPTTGKWSKIGPGSAYQSGSANLGHHVPPRGNQFPGSTRGGSSSSSDSYGDSLGGSDTESSDDEYDILGDFFQHEVYEGAPGSGSVGDGPPFIIHPT